MIEVMFETLDSELLVFAGDFSTDGLTLQDAYRKMSTNVWWKKQDVGHIGKNSIHLISNGVTTSLAQPSGVVWKGADEQHEVRHYHVFYLHGRVPYPLLRRRVNSSLISFHRGVTISRGAGIFSARWSLATSAHRRTPKQR